jgi:hypothetical protein
MMQSDLLPHPASHLHQLHPTAINLHSRTSEVDDDSSNKYEACDPAFFWCGRECT